MEKKEKENMQRHSMAHVLAFAVQKVFNEQISFGIGPSIDSGFYYDFDLKTQITPEHFEKIESAMQEILKSDLKFEKQVVSKKEALDMFKNQTYKTELINELDESEEISVYSLGDFVDLCKGPHIEEVKMLRGFAFKIARVSGAYWRGSEKNKMLQRVYVHGFLDKADLKQHLFMLAEAEKRDHRKLGRELELFFNPEYSQGMPLYMPKGMIIKNKLIEFWREMHTKAGYVEIESPIAMDKSLWEISGHWQHYKDNMYTFLADDYEDYALKPMNCPGGMVYYKEKLHSYKDFPLRVGELGKVHRKEASGTLHGLFRVRAFTQDDAHIFMLESQIADEVKNVIELVDKMYSVFGLSYTLELSTMPEDHIGEIETWEKAENALKDALAKIGKDYVINEGDGAFYGPKIDIKIKDAIGRTWQCGTIQLDMQLPTRFGCEYVDENGERKQPIMIHRVVYGSIDRFFGILTEHFAGAFPLWLAPEQVHILPISEKFEDYCIKVKDILVANNVRASVDLRNEKIGYKIRSSAKQKVPYILVIGENEIVSNCVSVRKRGSQESTVQSVEDFTALVKNEIENKTC